jgi:hypothetical protein
MARCGAAQRRGHLEEERRRRGSEAVRHFFERRSALVYVWDSKYPVGAIVPSPFFPNTEKAIVLESGPARIGKWVPERVNLVNDYRRTFGGNPPAVKSIVCATDSDQTHTPTTADFDDLQVTAHPQADRK